MMYGWIQEVLFAATSQALQPSYKYYGIRGEQIIVAQSGEEDNNCIIYQFIIINKKDTTNEASHGLLQ